MGSSTESPSPNGRRPDAATAQNGTLVVLGGRDLQQPLVRRGLERGHRVVVIDPDPSCSAGAIADRLVRLDLGDVAAIADVAAAESARAIVTFAADYPMRAVAAVAAQLGLPGPPPDAVDRASDKVAMREHLHTAGVRQPAFRWVDEPDDAGDVLTAVRGLGDHVIVKPARSAGSRGVQLVDADDHAALIEAMRFAASFGDGRVILEEYAEGAEVSVEGVAVDGEHRVLAITAKHLTPPPWFAEVGHDVPAPLSPSEERACAEVAAAVVSALGLDQCATHLELRLTADGPTVIEIGARFGGGFITSELVPLATGIDPIDIALDLALGIPPVLEPRRERGASIRFLCPPPGEVQRIAGVADAARMEGVERVIVSIEPGAVVRPVRSSDDRVGYVLTTAATSGEAAWRCEAARERIEVETV